MTITTQGIEDRYNTLFLTFNGGVNKTFSELTMSEKQLILLLLNAENVSGDGGGIGESVQVSNFPAFGTEVTLAAVLAKLSSDPATQSTLAAINSYLPTKVNNSIPVTNIPTNIVTTSVINRTTTTGDALILAPGAGLSIVWHGFIVSNLSANNEQTLTFRDGSGTALYPAIVLPVKVLQGHDSNTIIRKLAANTGVFVLLSSATASGVDIQLTYSVEAA